MKKNRFMIAKTLGVFVIALGLTAAIITACSSEDQLVEPRAVETQSENLGGGSSDVQLNLFSDSDPDQEMYNNMNAEDKFRFKQNYINDISIGGCSCDSCCSADCPPGTRPVCDCNGDDSCSCKCKSYAAISLAMKYNINLTEAGVYRLTPKSTSNVTLNRFAASNLPNRNDVLDIFNNHQAFDVALVDGTVLLTPDQYAGLEADMQPWVENYEAHEIFAVEFDFEDPAYQPGS